MNAHATAYVEVDSTLADVLGRLDGHEDRVLSIVYEGRAVQTGFHVTEVKAGSFVTLDCGGNSDSWSETVLQVEDIPGSDGKAQMTTGKFRSILGLVDQKVSLDHGARLTIEIGRPGEAMRVYDIAEVSITDQAAILVLGIRQAICKPRHRAEQATRAAACCGSQPKASACC